MVEHTRSLQEKEKKIIISKTLGFLGVYQLLTRMQFPPSRVKQDKKIITHKQNKIKSTRIPPKNKDKKRTTSIQTNQNTVTQAHAHRRTHTSHAHT